MIRYRRLAALVPEPAPIASAPATEASDDRGLNSHTPTRSGSPAPDYSHGGHGCSGSGQSTAFGDITSGGNVAALPHT